MAKETKGVLLFCKNSAVISASIQSLNDGIDLAETKSEIVLLARQFQLRGCDVYLSHLGSYEQASRSLDIWDTKTGQGQRVSLSKLNEKVSGLIFRTVGSLELQREMVKELMQACEQDFKGVVMNEPKTISYCLRKDYLQCLEQAGFEVPHSDYYPANIRLGELLGRYGQKDLSKFVIKPVTGEVSNSVATLNEINEDFLVRKSTKVGGWIVQNLIEEIWNGENQLVFIGNDFSHAFRKKYNKTEKSGIVPTRVDLDNTIYVEYSPTDQELRAAREIRRCLSKRLGLNPAISRIDFVNTHPEPPVIMEVEMVNPEIVAYDCHTRSRAEAIYGKVVDIFSFLCINRDALKQDGNIPKL